MHGTSLRHLYAKVGTQIHLADVYRQQGRYDEAAAVYREAINRTSGDKSGILARLAIVHAVTGDRAEALRLLEEVRRSPQPQASYDLAAAYAALGDKEAALASLDECVRRREPLLQELKIEPRFDSLRNDPRFAAMLRRVGLEP